MKKDRYTIGQFSAATGISKDTLRFYDKQGILQPNVVDTVSKYRYYTFDQFWYADMVVALVRLGVPLQTIKEVFSKKDDNVILSLLAERRGEALRLSEYYMRMADDIEWMERNQELEVLPQEDEVRVEYFTERKVMFRRNLGASLPEPDDCYDAQVQTDSIRRTTGRIMDMEDFLANHFTVFGSYLDMGMGGIDQVKPEHLTYLPAGEYACFVAIEDEYGEIDFEPVLDWLKEHDKTPSMVLVDRLSLGFFEEEEADDEEDSFEEDEEDITWTLSEESAEEGSLRDSLGGSSSSENSLEGSSEGSLDGSSKDSLDGSSVNSLDSSSEDSSKTSSEGSEAEDPTENFSEVKAGYTSLIGDVHVIEDFDLTEELSFDPTEELSEDMTEDITEDLAAGAASGRDPKKTLVKVRRKYEVKVLIK